MPHLARPSMVNRIISLHAEAIYEYRRLERLGWPFVGGREGGGGGVLGWVRYGGADFQQ